MTRVWAGLPALFFARFHLYEIKWRELDPIILQALRNTPKTAYDDFNRTEFYRS